MIMPVDLIVDLIAPSPTWPFFFFLSLVLISGLGASSHREYLSIDSQSIFVE